MDLAADCATYASSSRICSMAAASCSLSSRIHQCSGVAQHFGQSPPVGGDNRHAERHRLDDRDAEAFFE